MNKIICFIFGHRRTWKEFSGEYGTVFHDLIGDYIKVPIMIERSYKNCPRCGVELQLAK